jgi:ribosomal protein S19E (S16A)
LARDVSQAIFPVTRSAVNPVFQKQFENPATFRPTLIAIVNEPIPLAVDDYLRAAPYLNPDRATQLLTDATEAGFLASGNGSGFTITDSGREAMDEVNDVFYRYLDELDVLPEEGMDTLAGLLKQLVKNSLKADEPADKWAIVNMHNFHPKAEYAPLAKIDQYLDDLNAFRDDAHIASWQSYGLSGRTWETLSFVWQDQASSAAELVEKLPFRGFDEAAYAQSLTELTERGWVQETPEGFRVTEKGQSVRQEAEDVTNRTFFEPWAVLDHAEQTRLRRLLIRLKIDLQDLAEEVQ